MGTGTIPARRSQILSRGRGDSLYNGPHWKPRSRRIASMNRQVNGLGVFLMLCAGVALGGKAQAAYPTGAYPKFIISVDFRNDGINDIVTANYHDSSISV